MKKRILKNTAYLAIGNLLAKGVSLVIFIYLARILGPSEYGKYVTAIEFVMIVAIFANLGFDMTLIRKGAKNIQNAENVQLKAFPIRIGYAIFISLLAVVILMVTLQYPHDIQKYILLLLPLVVIGGLISSGITEHFLTSLRIIEDMKDVSLYGIVRVFIILFILIFFYILKINITVCVFIYATLISSIVSLIYLIYKVNQYYKKIFSVKIDKNFFQEIKEPVLLFGVVSIMYLITTKIDIQMLSFMKNSHEVGVYGVAWQIVNIGIVFISSFSMSLFPNSVRQSDNQTYRKKLFFYLLVVSLVISLVIFIISFFFRDIIVLLYGKEYLNSYYVLLLLVWFIPLRLFGLWGTQILEAMDKLKERIIIFFFPFVLNILLNYILIPEHGAEGAAFASLLSILLTAILTNAGAYFILRKNIEKQI